MTSRGEGEGGDECGIGIGIGAGERAEMPTCRAIIGEALRALKALAPGDDPDADELAAGMEAIGELILDIHEARGPMQDVDVTADYTAGENQRCRIQAPFTVNITLPNAIQLYPRIDPYDYGFTAPMILPSPGSTGSADGLSFRQPRDGTRIEIVGTSQALFFYRADINQWLAATGLSLDGEIPFNARYASALGALTAERLMETLPGMDEPTPGLARRIARGAAAMLLRPGTARDPVVAQYL